MKAIHVFFTITLSIFLTGTIFADDSTSIVEKEKKRMELNKKFDKLKLREKDDFVIDTSKDFLVEPPEEPAVGEFTVAKVPWTWVAVAMV